MWAKPSKKQLNDTPRLYETENVPLADKKVTMHFFVGGCDWYIVEFDGEDIMFGFAILNADYQNAEWGYISLAELRGLQVGPFEVDCDKHWEIRPVNRVDKIMEAMAA